MFIHREILAAICREWFIHKWTSLFWFLLFRISVLTAPGCLFRHCKFRKHVLNVTETKCESCYMYLILFFRGKITYFSWMKTFNWETVHMIVIMPAIIHWSISLSKISEWKKKQHFNSFERSCLQHYQKVIDKTTNTLWRPVLCFAFLFFKHTHGYVVIYWLVPYYSIKLEQWLAST